MININDGVEDLNEEDRKALEELQKDVNEIAEHIGKMGGFDVVLLGVQKDGIGCIAGAVKGNHSLRAMMKQIKDAYEKNKGEIH